MPKLVNFGCGQLIRSDWVNLDIDPRDPSVLPADFRHPLPFDSGTVDAIYHSHVLEHLDRDDAKTFLKENARVLKPGGVLRVVVPDLEVVVTHYLDALKGIERGEPEAANLAEWARLDLLDQMVRRTWGGKMIEFLKSIDFDNNQRLSQRLTLEMKANLKLIRTPTATRKRLTLSKIRKGLAWVAVHLLAGREAAQAFREGLFLNSGELHRWMWDRDSLKRAIEEAGLVDIQIRGARDSAIAGFASYELDTVGDAVRRPGSLFVEGRKPSGSAATTIRRDTLVGQPKPFGRGAALVEDVDRHAAARVPIASNP